MVWHFNVVDIQGGTEHHISNTEWENGEYPVVWLSPVDCTCFSAKKFVFIHYFFSFAFTVFASELILFKYKCYFHNPNYLPKMRKQKKKGVLFACVLKTVLSLTSWQNCSFYTAYLSCHPVSVSLHVQSFSANAGNICYVLLATPGAAVPQSL